MNDNKKNLVFAILIVAMIAGITAVIFNLGEKSSKKAVDLNLELDSDLASKDPKESAANFLLANGTIGDLKGLTEDEIGYIDFKENFEMRQEAFDKAKTIIIDDSPIITGEEQETIDEDLSMFPVFYSIENLAVSEPYAEKRIKVNHDKIGEVEYDSVKINLDFDSVQTVFYWATDVNMNNVVEQMEARDSFKDVVVELVKVDGLWYIYDMENSEYTLNARLATWSGRGNYDVSRDQTLIKEYNLKEDVYE